MFTLTGKDNADKNVMCSRIYSPCPILAFGGIQHCSFLVTEVSKHPEIIETKINSALDCECYRVGSTQI